MQDLSAVPSVKVVQPLKAWGRGEALALSRKQDAEILAIDEALVALAAVDARKSQGVELPFWGGSVEEAAEVLKASPETVKRNWRFVKAWLHRALSGEKNDEGGALAAS